MVRRQRAHAKKTSTLLRWNATIEIEQPASERHDWEHKRNDNAWNAPRAGEIASPIGAGNNF